MVIPHEHPLKIHQTSIGVGGEVGGRGGSIRKASPQRLISGNSNPESSGGEGFSGQYDWQFW